MTSSNGTAAAMTATCSRTALYTYSLTATDQAGNTGASKPIALRIDTEKKPVRVSTDLVYFSPFGSGTKTRDPDHSLPRGDRGVDSSTIQVRGADGTVGAHVLGPGKGAR